MEEEFNVPEFEPNKLDKYIDSCLVDLAAQVADIDQLIVDSRKIINDSQEMLSDIAEIDVITDDQRESSIKSIQEFIAAEQERIKEYERAKAELNIFIIQFEAMKQDNTHFIYKPKNQQESDN